MKYLLFFITMLFTLADLSAQTDWKYQVTQFVDNIGSPTSAVNSHYNWGEESDLRQGIRINLKPNKEEKIYVEANNSFFKFAHSEYKPEDNNKLRHLSVKVGNGNFQTIYEGGIFNYKLEISWNSSTTFTVEGEFDLTVKFKRQILGVMYTRERIYKVKVVPKSDEWHRDQHNNSIRVWKSGNSNAKPFLVSVGLDAHNVLPEQYLRYNMKSLLNCLLEDQQNPHDIYILYYRYNPQDLRNNAAVFASAMMYTSDIGYGGKKIAIGGRSMGSLAGRYALAKAEQEGNPLPVTTWTSLDSPHQGSSLSPQLQDVLRPIIDAMPTPFLRKSNDNPGAKIMLKYNPYNSSGSMHDAYYGEMNNLNGNGFPHLTHNVGVAFSNSTPNPESGIWLSILLDGEPIYFFLMTAEDRRPGSRMPKRELGGLGEILVVNQTKDPTFLTYKSALDINDNDTNPANDLANSRFDIHVTAPITRFHDVFPDEIASEIAAEIIAADKLFLQNVDIEGDAEHKARTEIQAGNNVRSDRATGDAIVENNADIVFRAGQTVALKPGFTAEKGTDFLAKIQSIALPNCDPPEFTGGHGDAGQRNGAGDEQELLTDVLDLENELTLYPNPVLDEITIEYKLAKAGRVNMRLVNSQGQVIRTLVDVTEMSSGEHQTQFDISDLPKGIYFLQVTIGKTPFYKKVIKL